MAYSQVIVAGDGVSTLLPVSFALGIISPNDVSCRVTGEFNSSGQPLNRQFVIQSPGLIQVVGQPAPIGQNYVFTRRVSKTALVVDWEDDNPITEVNLNTAQKQSLMVAHEALDQADRALKMPDGYAGFLVDPNLNSGDYLVLQNGVVTKGATLAQITSSKADADRAAGAAQTAVLAADRAEDVGAFVKNGFPWDLDLVSVYEGELWEGMPAPGSPGSPEVVNFLADYEDGLNGTN